MYLYNVHYWISLTSPPMLVDTHSPFSLSCPSSLFIQVKLDTAPYEPPFTAADKKELQTLLSLSPSQGTFLQRQQCPIRPIIEGAPKTFFPYQIPSCKADNGSVQCTYLTCRQRLLRNCLIISTTPVGRMLSLSASVSVCLNLHHKLSHI